MLPSLVFVSLRGATHPCIIGKREYHLSTCLRVVRDQGSRANKDSGFEPRPRTANRQSGRVAISYLGCCVFSPLDPEMVIFLNTDPDQKIAWKKLAKIYSWRFFLAKNDQYCFFNTLKGLSGSGRCLFSLPKSSSNIKFINFFVIFWGPLWPPGDRIHWPFVWIRTYSIRNTDFPYGYPLPASRIITHPYTYVTLLINRYLVQHCRCKCQWIHVERFPKKVGK